MIANHCLAAQKLAQVPELLSMVCAFLGSSGCRTVACVSHRFFNAAAPIIWEEVEGVHNLLALFPGTEVIRTAIPGKRTNILRTCVPSNPDFTRFNIYAPLVKALNIYGCSDHPYEFTNWKALTSREAPLLPKLLSLTIKFARSLGGYDDQILWITTLLSPSLREIRAMPAQLSKHHTRTPAIPPLLVALMLKKVVPQCPHLKVLSIFPDPNVDEDQAEKPLSTFLSMSEPPFHYYLAQAQQLCELTSNEQILKHDVLLVIGSLPQLARLEIYTDQIDICPESIPLPDYTFPALRQLTLHLSYSEGIEDLWKLGALRQLTSLKIDFKDQHDDGSDSRDIWARSLLIAVADNSPNLKHLDINFSTCDACGDEPCNLGDYLLFEEMSTLPLETVTLASAWFGPYDADLYSRLAHTWPAVVDLHMPNQPATLQELFALAKLPKLEHLVLDLSLNHPSVACDPKLGQPVALSLHTLESSTRSAPLGDLAAIAKHLLLLWPSLQQVLWPGFNSPFIGAGSQAYATIMQSLNSWITTIREMSDLKNHISQTYGTEELTFFNGIPTIDRSYSDC